MYKNLVFPDESFDCYVESTILAPTCPNMVIWLKIIEHSWFKLCTLAKKMYHINIDLSMKSNHFSQEKVHESPFSDTRSPTIGYDHHFKVGKETMKEGLEYTPFL